VNTEAEETDTHHCIDLAGIWYHYSFVSGGEDGYIRIHPLTDKYFSELSNEALYGRGAAPTATIPFY
jgi:hypothetical protein